MKMFLKTAMNALARFLSPLLTFQCNGNSRQGSACSVQSQSLIPSEYSEVVTNSEGSSVRTLNIEAPSIENANSLQFRYQVPSADLNACEVSVDTSNSIFGTDAQVFVTKNLLQSEVVVTISAEACDKITADGEVFTTEISNLSGNGSSVTIPGGDITLVVIIDI